MRYFSIAYVIIYAYHCKVDTTDVYFISKTVPVCWMKHFV